jgi:murein DD-endopeptidase MepM/ murein hydrolase activator NlpD
MSIVGQKNLLPKIHTDGVAPKTHESNISLSRFFRGLRKQKEVGTIIKIVAFRLPLLLILGGYLLGYQPVMGFPPVQKSKALAQTNATSDASFTQTQAIETVGLSHPFQLPHIGYISTHFSAWHPGIDIAVGYGTPIRPISNGKVVEIHYDLFGLGHHVVIEHDQGYRSTYGHMDRVYVRVGDEVNEKSIIGTVGMTGHTTGPHTHLEVTKNGGYIDPTTLLPNLSDIPQGYPSYQENTEASASSQLITQYNVPTAASQEIESHSAPSLNLKKELKFNL